jgi:hypothetical protein
MTDSEPESLVLRILRDIRSDVRSVHEDVRDVRRRVSNLEGSVALLHSLAAQQNSRTDDIADRLVRIEKRLGLVEA